jgi:nucleosome binding factor SPN SPT16 subunit
MPTVNCLVELTEMPFTCITLSDINIVNMERVGFNLRNFDMVFVWKDLVSGADKEGENWPALGAPMQFKSSHLCPTQDRDVGRIDAIPSHHLDSIREWLTSW